MKKIITIIIFFVFININTFAQFTSLSGAVNIGTHQGMQLYSAPQGSKITYNGRFQSLEVNSKYLYNKGKKGAYASKKEIVVNDNNNFQKAGTYNTIRTGANIGYSSFKSNTICVFVSSPLFMTQCANKSNEIHIGAKDPIKWERSLDGGLSWSDIQCNARSFVEENPRPGTYLYRVLNSDGTYSEICKVIYTNAVPETINTLPTVNTKMVDESVVFTLGLTDDHYTYQWYKDNTAIEGATANTYSIDLIKTIHEGSYYCAVGNGYNSVNSKPSSLVVNKCPQIITIDEIPVKDYGQGDFYLPKTTNKGLIITYQSTNTNVAEIEDNKVRIKNPGSTTIIASQVGNDEYLLASTVERKLTVNKQNQVIIFGGIPTKTYGDANIILPATSDKGLAISYQSTNMQVATVDGNVLTIVGAGETNIVATQSGDDCCYAATPVIQTLTVNKSMQNITFPNFEAKTYGDADIVLNQYSDAGLEIIYASNDNNIAQIEGNAVKLKNAGAVQITAQQVGDKNYLGATSITRTLIIQKANQSIALDKIEPKTYGDADFYLNAIANNGLPIEYVSANENVVKVIGNKVQITGAGNTTITAQQIGNSNYNPTQAVSLPITISKAIQTISFNQLEEKTYGDVDFTLQATNSSGLPIIYTSSNPEVAEVTNNVVTIKKAGSTTITASALGNDNYYKAEPQGRLLKINKAK
ncbi:hypothetical protein M2138_001321 [Dysgonomonadaceae bacterium PH5-43]|nr:hypothetical protein [Dysgonomonadaceae bacterium PH5-43]